MQTVTTYLEACVLSISHLKGNSRYSCTIAEWVGLVNAHTCTLTDITGYIIYTGYIISSCEDNVAPKYFLQACGLLPYLAKASIGTCQFTM